MRNLLGGKGANLAEMTNLGLPIPQGFTVTTEACTDYYAQGKQISDEIKEQIFAALADLEKKKEQIVAKSREEAARILDNARFQSNQLLNTLEELKKEMNQSNAAEKLSVAKLAAKRGIDDIENLTDPVENNKDENYVLERTPIIGDTVVIISLNKKASVTKVDEKNKKVYVSSGNMNLWINFDDIKLSQKDKKTELPKTRNVSRLKSRSERSVSGEIDIRGMASDEGVTEVDRYIDEAILAGIETITVIHGKGTGVLRAAVHSHLRRHINVEGFRVGTFGEGENGVTIVTLKK